MARKQKIGFWGQKIAEDFLLSHGYCVIGRNIRTKFGEIDLIAERLSEFVFVEVKTRTNDEFGPPENAITFRKKEHMIQSAEAYIQSREENIESWRLDVIAIKGKPGEENIEIEWFENVVS